MCLALLKTCKITNNYKVTETLCINSTLLWKMILVLIFTHLMKKKYGDNLTETTNSRYVMWN